MFGPSTMLSAATAGIEPPTVQASKRPTRSALLPRAINSIGVRTMTLPPFPGGQKAASEAARSPDGPCPPPRVDVQQGSAMPTLYSGLPPDVYLALRRYPDLLPARHPFPVRLVDTRPPARVTSGHLDRLQGRRSSRQENCRRWTSRRHAATLARRPGASGHADLEGVTGARADRVAAVPPPAT